MRVSTRFRCAIALMVAASACSDGDDSDRDRDTSGESAAVDPATAQLALDELTSNVDITVTGFSTQSTASPAAAGAAGGAAPVAQGAIDLACASGGNARVDGYVNVAAAPVMVDVKVAINYDACVTRGGNILAGELEFSQTVAAGPGTPLRVETLYQGDIAFSGRIQARCPVDLNVLVDETGRAVQVNGSFCGQAATMLRLQLTPHWQSGAAGSAR
jgi:hypothetical protein